MSLAGLAAFPVLLMACGNADHKVGNDTRPDPRAATEGAQTALHRSTDIDVRKLHVTLIRMAVENPHLADVWPSNVSAGPQAKSQHMYCNLLLQHVWLQYQIEMATREETISNLRYLFASPKMRAFWKDTASNRNSIYNDDTRDSGLAAEADRIWHEYEEVLACDRQTGDLPTAEAPMEAASLP